MAKSQNEIILEALEKGPLTTWDAIQRFGITRLGARVFELKEDGHRIRSEMIDVRSLAGVKRVAQYTLEDRP